MRRWPVGRGAVSAVALILAIVAVAGSLGATREVGAQGTITLRGVAYDSVARRPLPGALVTLDGIRSTFSDEGGAFAFDSVESGDRLLEMTHAVLDSMGLPGVAMRLRVAAGGASVTIAVPSFATLWRAACGERPAPADSGFVYGAVRSGLDGREVPSAGVELTWSDIRVENIRQLSGRRYRVETESDANGEYGICGVPLDAGMRVQARSGALASAALDLLPTALRIMRRDLLLGPLDTTSDARGSIVGTVSRSQGGPFEGATIVLDDVPQLRTGADGRFVLPSVLAGSRQVEVLGIGARPQLFSVDVVAGQEATIAAVLERVTTLDVVRITGSPWQVRMLEGIEQRKQAAFARFIDSTVTSRRSSMGTVFAGLNGLYVTLGRFSTQDNIMMRNPDGDPCVPNVRIDGVRSDMEMLREMHPAEIGVTEVYPRASSVPIELQVGVSNCGMIVVWTKRVMP